MKPSRRRAIYDDVNGGHISVSSSGSIDREEQQSDDEDDKAPEALRRLQRKLTTAMEHMERAQLEFFHVERAFQDRKQQKQNQTCAEQSVPWSLKVQLYCEFWQQFVVQLRSALRGDDDSNAYDDESNELAIQALSVLASNVWGETRASPQEVFRNGPIALAPQTRPTVHQHNRRLAKHHENENTAVAFSEIGPYQDVAQCASRVKPAMQSLKSLILSSAAAQNKSSTITIDNNVSGSNGKAAAHTASRPRKKIKTCAKEAGAAGNGTGTSHKASAATGVNGARQSVASEPSRGVQSVAPKPRASETSSSALAAKSPAKSAPAKIRLDARNPSDMIGFFDRLLADRGLSPTASNQQGLTGTSPAASVARPQQHQRRKKVTVSLSAHKLLPVALEGEDEDDDNDDQAALQLVPIPKTPSNFSETIVQIKQGIAGSGQRRVGSATSHVKKKTKMIGTPRYAFNEHLRQQIQDQLGASEVFPDIHIPFPREHLIFDPNEHPLLANHHEVFWQSNIAAYLEMVYYHPVAGDIKRVSLGKTRLLRRQRVLLGKYIETLGIVVVARKLQAQEATFPFFFVKSINSLDSLSSEQLSEHLDYLKEPWRSPVTQAHGVSWWEALLRKTSSSGVKKHNVLEINEAAKQQIASAHFRGALEFDTLWLRLSTQSPWKEMLDERRDARVGASLTTTNATCDDEHEHGLPQSPPHRKKVAGKVPMNRENTRVSNRDTKRWQWLQHFVNQKDHHAESSSTSSDEDDEDDSGVKLGKRLRTSKN